MNSRRTCAAGLSWRRQVSRNWLRSPFSTRMRTPASLTPMAVECSSIGYTSQRKALERFGACVRTGVQGGRQRMDSRDPGARTEENAGECELAGIQPSSIPSITSESVLKSALFTQELADRRVRSPNQIACLLRTSRRIFGASQRGRIVGRRGSCRAPATALRYISESGANHPRCFSHVNHPSEQTQEVLASATRSQAQVASRDWPRLAAGPAVNASERLTGLSFRLPPQQSDRGLFCIG